MSPATSELPRSERGTRKETRLTLFALALLLSHTTPARADAKTAVIVQQNGDRVTCELKELKRGQILVKTDAMGTLYVEWDKVVRVTSPVRQEVQVASGERYYGPLEPSSGDGRLVVLSPGGPVELDLSTIVSLRPIRSSFWHRFDGSLDLGGTYTQANSLLQLTPSFSTTYGARTFATGVDVDWTLTRQEGKADSERGALVLRYGHFFAKHWVAFGRATAQRNTELGLDLRSELAGGVGHFLVSTNHSLFLAGAGLGGNRERPFEGGNTTNLEALVVVEWQLFSYNFPKTDVKFSFLLYPSLTESGRVRGDTDLSVKRELLRNFTVGLRVYDSFDNRPATEGASTNDWGATLSLGWTF